MSHVVARLLVKKLFVACLFVAVGAHAADDRAFVATDVPGIGIHHTGKVVIRNTGNTITAWRFFGDVREALVSLTTSRSMVYHPYGGTVFNGGAPIATRMPDALAAIVRDAAATHGVDPRLVAAVAGRESAYNPRAVSRVGACGLMQLMPATAKYLGIGDVFDARQNVFAGTRYLRKLLDTFHGDLDLTLAAYNAGPGAVQRYNGVPPFPETRAYVVAVRREYERTLR